MRKLAVVASALCFIFVSSCSNCNKNTDEGTATCDSTQQQEVKKECCKMTEEQKAECEAFCKQWKDWSNLTEDVKKELIAQTKARFDKQDAEMEAKLAVCKAEWATFDNLTLDEQKALLDKRMQCGKKCHGEKKCCNKDKESCEKKCDAKKEK
jgi:hypothetical protein